jgi:hypothetical protein
MTTAIDSNPPATLAEWQARRDEVNRQRRDAREAAMARVPEYAYGEVLTRPGLYTIRQLARKVADDLGVGEENARTLIARLLHGRVFVLDSTRALVVGNIGE